MASIRFLSLSLREIAEILEKKETTIRSLLKRGREKLARMLPRQMKGDDGHAAGIYECIEDDNSFSTFSVAIAQLPETKWFPLLVEKWLWYIQGEVEDCISSLKGITL